MKGVLKENFPAILFYTSFFIYITCWVFWFPHWGHNGDVYMCLNSWSSDLLKYGITTHGWINYYPIGRYLFYLFGVFEGSPEAITQHLWHHKLIYLVFDCSAIILVYRLLKKHLNISSVITVIFTLVLLLNPALWYNTVVFGQMDSLYILLLLLSVYFLHFGKVEAATFWIIVGINTKPQFLTYLPLLGPILLLKTNFNWAQILKCLFIAVLTQLLILLPFILKDFPSLSLFKADLYRIYVDPIVESHNFLSVSSFNIWTLFFGEEAFLISSYQTGMMGLSYKLTGFILFLVILFVVIFTIFRTYFRAKQNSLAILVLGICLICTTFYLFPTNMHERYLQPFVVFGGIYVILSKKWYNVLFYISFSYLYLLTLAYQMRGSFGVKIPLYNSFIKIPIQTVSMFFIALWVWLCVELYLQTKNAKKR